MCKRSQPGYLLAVDMLWSHQGHTREEAAVLCPLWTSLTPLPRAASSFSFSFGHSSFAHSLSRFVSPSLSIWIVLSPLLYPSFPVCLPGVKSSLMFFFFIRHVSVFPLFPNFFARRPQLTPPLPHQLRVFQTKTI